MRSRYTLPPSLTLVGPSNREREAEAVALRRVARELFRRLALVVGDAAARRFFVGLGTRRRGRPKWQRGPTKTDIAPESHKKRFRREKKAEEEQQARSSRNERRRRALFAKRGLSLPEFPGSANGRSLLGDAMNITKDKK